MRVTAPNRAYNGRYGTDVFINGVCENASERHRAYYVAAGYDVDGKTSKAPENKAPKQAEQPAPEQRETKKVTAQQAPPRSATTDEWREFAESIDLDIDEDARRSDIIAAYVAAQAAN